MPAAVALHTQKAVLQQLAPASVPLHDHPTLLQKPTQCPLLLNVKHRSGKKLPDLLQRSVMVKFAYLSVPAVFALFLSQCTWGPAVLTSQFGTEDRRIRTRHLVMVGLLLALFLGRAQAQQTYSLTDLGTLSGTHSHGAALNEAGEVTGDSYTTGDAAYHTFLWDGSTVLDLGTFVRFRCGSRITSGFWA